jgi:SSS family solute:Na+ symporter
MSSADSSLLAATSLVTNNIVYRLRPRMRKKNILPLARASTIIIGVISLVLALRVKHIYHLMVNSWATLFVGIFVPVTAALYWKKANATAAWVSMILGTGTWLGYILFCSGTLEEIADPLFYRAAAYGGAASFISYIVVTLIRYKRIEPIRLPSEYPVK